MSNKNWSGSSMESLYENNDPYSFTITPLVPSKQHAVLYELPATLSTPPKPYRSRQTHHWDKNYVKMPYAPENVFPIKNENGDEILINRWELIEKSLVKPINTSQDLEAAIQSYNSRLPKFLALHQLFKEVLEEEQENETFFKTLLPGIIRLALQLPEILPGNLPLLQKDTCNSISLSQLQIASLLANAFLCTFPWRKEVSTSYPGANFSRLFSSFLRRKRETCVIEKIKAICHYFRRVLTKTPVGVVTFERKHLLKKEFPRWDRLDTNLGNTKVHICSTGTIENNGNGLLQVDFANKFVGGGVLGYGCVQEEIRFAICPELIISRLFTEELGSSEALVITGAERYSNYTGYGDTFVWDGDYIDQTPHDCYGRRKTTIVAIDATRFQRQSDQFNTSSILRELNKAYVGFHSESTGKSAPVATGNWGCGAFKGDPRLKSLIQFMACSAAKRNMVYYTFDDNELEKTLYNMFMFLANNKVTICELWRMLCGFVVSKAPLDNFIPYLQQAYFDLNNQPRIKKFFGSKPSTSSSSAFKTGTWPIKNSKSSTNKRSLPTTSASTKDFTRSRNSDSNLKNVDDEDEIDNFKIETLPTDKRSPILTQNKDEKNVNSRSIIDIFKIIDGDISEDKEENNALDTSLLTSIDKFSGNKDSKSVDKKCDSVCIDMEVDEANDYNDHKIGPKRKISDYFSKINK